MGKLYFFYFTQYQSVLVNDDRSHQHVYHLQFRVLGRIALCRVHHVNRPTDQTGSRIFDGHVTLSRRLRCGMDTEFIYPTE